MRIQQDPSLHDEKCLNESARLVESRLFIVAGAARMTLSTVTDRLHGLLIRRLHLLEGLNHGSTEYLYPSVKNFSMHDFSSRFTPEALASLKASTSSEA